jgi:transglutaminase-like putative cysteine protease
MSWRDAVGATVLVAVGMLFSYQTRVSPPGWVKICAALAAMGSLIWFVQQIDTGPLTDITKVENPLTVLFALIQIVHSFHVPSRRDLIFAAGASAATVAVAAGQAVATGFGVYVLLWLAFLIWMLLELWAAQSGGGVASGRQLVGFAASLVVAAGVVFVTLPAPVATMRTGFASAAGDGGTVPHPGALAGDSGSAAELSKPGTSTGPTHVGGYLGFAGSLDTALRGKLSKQVVMRVRADRPGYWVGETFDRWNGQSWSTSGFSSYQVGGTSPIEVPTPLDSPSGGGPDLQTFYVVQSTADLVFHSGVARQLWFPASEVYVSPPGTIVSPIGLGNGAVYTVESQDDDPSPTALRQAAGATLPPGQVALYTELPSRYDRVKALAESITSAQPDTYDKVQALIAWIGANTRYSTDIPALPAGSDTVDDFLFGSRTGFCEQISTSLAVMLRTLGIPAREAVGYVPGPYNPLTDLYDVQADDAHAWVQVWFPGYGWQNFDPTAVVPEANPSPGATAVHDLGKDLGQLPLVPLGLTVAVAALPIVARRWSKARPATWAAQLASRIERAGRKAGRPRLPGETITEYAAALDQISTDRPGRWEDLARAVEASAYGGEEPAPDVRRQLLARAGSRH